MNKLKTYLILSLISITIACCTSSNKRTIESIKQGSFEKKQISKGNNNPSKIVYEKNIDVLLVSLYYGKTIEEITNALGWSKDKVEENIALLIDKGILLEKNGVYMPTVCILPLEEGNSLKEKSQPLANEISDSIIANLEKFKQLHSRTHAAKEYSFKQLSFFYLSDILLDMGQIGNVESDFLKKERPLRHGKNYYFAIVEKDTTSKTEALGIYGNQGLLHNDSIYIGVYGNKRFQKVGWNNYENKKVYCFNKHDSNILFKELNESYRKTLIAILEKHKDNVMNLFCELGYADKISFEEFFIWYYHIIYTEATNLLIEKGLIELPDSNLFYYQIEM